MGGLRRASHIYWTMNAHYKVIQLITHLEHLQRKATPAARIILVSWDRERSMWCNKCCCNFHRWRHAGISISLKNWSMREWRVSKKPSIWCYWANYWNFMWIQHATFTGRRVWRLVHGGNNPLPSSNIHCWQSQSVAGAGSLQHHCCWGQAVCVCVCTHTTHKRYRMYWYILFQYQYIEMIHFVRNVKGNLELGVLKL